MITFATIGRFDRRYEEAAADLGATFRGNAFSDIILPIIAPGDNRRRAVRIHAVLRRVPPLAS